MPARNALCAMLQQHGQEKSCFSAGIRESTVFLYFLTGVHTTYLQNFSKTYTNTCRPAKRSVFCSLREPSIRISRKSGSLASRRSGFFRNRG